MIRLLYSAALSSAPGDSGNGKDRAPRDEEYTHDAFMELSLADLEEITGVIRPKSQTTETVQKYRESAWASYRQDVTNRDEWGNSRQSEEEPDEPDEPVDPENEGYDEPDIDLDNVIEEQLGGDPDDSPAENPLVEDETQVEED